LLPLGFLIALFTGGAVLRRRHVDMDGDPPIDRRLFYASKYSIVLIWASMVAQAWGVDLAVVEPLDAVWIAALAAWCAGFALLFAGRLGLGGSFRIGSPKEPTRLRVAGLFSLSRNPMYLGVYATLLGSVLYTLNPAVLLLSGFVIAVHHRIVLAEETYLHHAFGEEYADYCRHVRRYL
jgi:protein-S-isoprenylcysteine O-methyltransferase Ste14